MIGFSVSGSYSKTESFFKKVLSRSYRSVFEKYGREGVAALAAATPVDSGKTANSWSYEVRESAKGFEIVWTNSNVVNGAPIAILLQYGHGTGTGGYVPGRDYINPAMRPVLEAMMADGWKAMVNP